MPRGIASRAAANGGSPGVFDDARRHLRPLLLLTTVLEATAAAATLATRIPAWAASAVLVGMPLASYAAYQTRRARGLERQVRELYNFDRRYDLYVSRWTFRESETAGYLASTNYSERDLVALRPVPRWTWAITRRQESDLPFTDAPPRVLRVVATRSGDGTCTAGTLLVEAAKLTLPIEFEPMLRPDERVHIEVEIDVPQHKAARLDVLSLRPRPTTPLPGEFEFITTDIGYPTREYRVEALIPARLGTARHGIQALMRGYKFTEEETFIERTDAFAVMQTTLNGEPAWHLRLRRIEPPVRTTYRMYWQPPDS